MAGVTHTDVITIDQGARTTKADLLVAEEPLEIRLIHQSLGEAEESKLAVTMRTPGHDLELATGFLYTEGIISSYSDLANIRHCEDRDVEHPENIVKAYLNPNLSFDTESLQRNFYSTSSCGICGKASVEAIYNQDCSRMAQDEIRVTSDFINSLSAKLDEEQTLFRHTGGLHAAAIFDLEGNIEIVREDVGRHNAVDKVIGVKLIQKQVPMHQSILFVSGRAGFELVQKCISASIPVMVAVGAPSSLAVDTAKEFNLTLIGFARNGRFNVYSSPHRIAE